jgi:hypothetical protein
MRAEGYPVNRRKLVSSGCTTPSQGKPYPREEGEEEAVDGTEKIGEETGEDSTDSESEVTVNGAKW